MPSNATAFPVREGKVWMLPGGLQVIYFLSCRIVQENDRGSQLQ